MGPRVGERRRAPRAGDSARDPAFPRGVLSAGVLSPAESRARVVQSRAFSAESNPGAHTDASKEVFRSLTFRREHRALRDAEPRFMDLVCSSQQKLQKKKKKKKKKKK